MTSVVWMVAGPNIRIYIYTYAHRVPIHSPHQSLSYTALIGGSSKPDSQVWLLLLLTTSILHSGRVIRPGQHNKAADVCVHILSLPLQLKMMTYPKRENEQWSIPFKSIVHVIVLVETWHQCTWLQTITETVPCILLMLLLHSQVTTEDHFALCGDVLN